MILRTMPKKTPFPDYTQSSSPASPTSGEFWWDTSIHVLKRYNGTSWDWVGLDDLANVDTAGKADTDIVEWDTGTSSWVDVTKPSGGGGGGGTTWLDPVPSGNGPGGSDDDEFADSTVDAAWTTVTTGATAPVITEGADVLSIHLPAGVTTSALHSVVKPVGSFGAGDAVTTAVRRLTTNANASGNNLYAGIILADGTTYGAGNQITAGTYYPIGTGRPGASLRAWTNFNSFAALDFTTGFAHIGPWIYYRLRWVSANAWRMDISIDGVGWLDLSGADWSRTLTPTHMGVFMQTSNSSGVDFLASFEYFRVS